jgi:hypothetical protein
MATRYSVSLVHAGCDHTGFVVWEERERADARGVGGPVVVGLPRGFVSLNSEDGAVEIVCAGCRQTVASAARADPPVSAEEASDPAAVASDAAAGDAIAGEPGAHPAAPATDQAADHAADHAAEAPAVPTVDPATAPAVAAAAPGTEAAADPQPGEATGTTADSASEDKVRADIEALFAQADDVAPIRGDAIPPHLLDKLRHLADRMRQRRE